MKVTLVVASGAHEGRVIPLTGPQFLIGRDEKCQLRPASQAISKMHCAVLIREGKVFIKDFGSTNGTLINDQLIQGAEVQVQDGATLRVGPLEFRVRITPAASKPDGTPFPPETAGTLAAVQAAKQTAPTRDATPNPAKPSPSGVTPKPTAPTQPGAAESPALKPDSKEVPSLTTSESVTEEDQDRIAAMLLGMDDDGNSSVPDGSTVMDIPTPLAAGNDPTAAKAGEKKDDDKPKRAQTREEMSNAANDLLRKYMRRPR
ncbi:MAG: FHA domain-containing protein [Gemmataceae bacterium]|nr:FHA domain-containing protein [Gemmata sp.]MDW8197126.1 FHA domain-containing protein [Gemmataceae bacterium]